MVSWTGEKKVMSQPQKLETTPLPFWDAPPGKKYNILGHSDADGIYSTALMAKSLGDRVGTANFTNSFGQLSGQENIVLDMVPDLNTWPKANIPPLEALWVFDHHPQHPEPPPYTLIKDHVPTTLIVFNHVRSKLPEEEYWKIVGGLAGDGQEALTPPFIWKKYPELRDEIVTSYKSYGDIKQYRYPIWSFLSSGVNAMAKTGDPYKGFLAVATAKNPIELVTNPLLKAAKMRIDKEVERIREESLSVYLGNGIQFRYFDSQFDIQSNLAWEDSGQNKTSVSLNRKTGRGSMRGPLEKYIEGALNERGIKAGGHAGFGGLTLKAPQNEQLVLEILRGL